MDIVELLFRARTNELDQASRKLNQVGNDAKGAQRHLDAAGSAGGTAGVAIAAGANTAKVAVSSLTLTVRNLLAPLVAVQSAVSFVKLGAETEQLMMRLETATGSANNARIAMQALQDFAKETPYSLTEVATSFQKLVNLGLDPSEKALRSYGNTASAMGKSMDQMIEAVADASMGEFERLKEFGIRASKQGDQVTFTFQGVTTTVKNSSTEIEKYLQSIGENKFGDAMANQANTLSGAWSNLSDNLSSVFSNLFTQGKVGEFLRDQIVLANKWLDSLLAWFKQGGFERAIDDWKKAFSGWYQLIGGVIDLAMKAFGGLVSFMRPVVVEMGAAFVSFPLAVKNSLLEAVARIGGFVDKVKAYGIAIGKFLTDPFSAADTARALDKSLGNTEARVEEYVRGLRKEVRDAEASFRRLTSIGSDIYRNENYGNEARNKRGTGKDPLSGFRVAGGPPAPKPTPPTAPAPATAKPRTFGAENGDYSDGRIAREGNENRLQQTAVLAQYNDEAEKEYQALMKRVQGYRELGDPLQRSRDLLAQMTVDFASGAMLPEEFAAAVKKLKEEMASLDESWKSGSFLDGMKRGMDDLNKQIMTTAEMGKYAFNSFAEKSADAFANFALTGKLNFKDFARSFLADIAQMIAKQAILNGLKMVMGGFADGGAFSGGTQFFANGGVVSQPTRFGMAGGRQGVMGEAGPEAIMPLRRGANGKLGVVAAGATGNNSVHVQVNVKVEGGSDPEKTATLTAQKVQEQFTRGIARQEIERAMKQRAYAV